jgi:hypothetical protein
MLEQAGTVSTSSVPGVGTEEAATAREAVSQEICGGGTDGDARFPPPSFYLSRED